MINKIKKELFKIQDLKYKDFSSSLLPGIDNVIGVRLPDLRKIAKNIIKENYEEYFLKNNDEYFELTMLEGMMIGLLKEEFSKKLSRLEKFIPKINNWSVCDCTISGLKSIKDNKKATKTFLKKYLKSNNEFELRFAFVVLLNYFIEDDFDYVLEEILKFNNKAYYSKMAVAWVLSYCFMKNFDKTLLFIKNNKINPFVLKKGIQKTKESYRITKEQKELLSSINKSLCICSN